MLGRFNTNLVQTRFSVILFPEIKAFIKSEKVGEHSFCSTPCSHRPVASAIAADVECSYRVIAVRILLRVSSLSCRCVSLFWNDIAVSTTLKQSFYTIQYPVDPPSST